MHLLIPAAGRGSRMGAAVNKLLLPVAGQPLLAWTLRAVAASHTIRWIGIVGQPEDQPAVAAIVDSLASTLPPTTWIVGGATRQQSVQRGLAALPIGSERVLIHDGARCLATPALFDRCTAALTNCQALVAAVPVKDTLKRARSDCQVVEATVPREHLWAAQTPQGFLVPMLIEAHRLATDAGVEVTDDAALCEWQGIDVVLVAGEQSNLKVTTPEDLQLAEAILTNRKIIG